MTPIDYRFQADIDCPFCAITPGMQQAARGLHWHDHWSQVGVREYIVTTALYATALGIYALPDDETDADWTGPILFDEAVRDALAFDSPTSRNAAKNASDLLFFGSIAHVMLVDNLLVTWVGRQSPEVAWQLFVINNQAYALTLALNSAVKRLTSRERPWGERCETGENVEHDCTGGSRYVAFYSGHSAVTATSAGLLCAHHTQLRLYKNPLADSATCVAGILMTGATGALRIASDNHWASDVLMGHLMGYVSGYLLPTLLYYKEFRITPEPDHAPVEPQMAILPLVGPSSVELGAFGTF